MKQIVENYKKEVQAYLNDENEPPVEIALPSVGADLQEAFAMQRRRLKSRELKMIMREAILKDGKQEGECLKEYIENTSKYYFKNGENDSISQTVQKAYCVKADMDAKKKVMLVEVKDTPFKPYIKKIQEFLQYYFGDTEYIRWALTETCFFLFGIALTFVTILLMVGINYVFYDNRPWKSVGSLLWPVPFVWVILAIFYIVKNKPRIKKKSPRTALLSIQSRKPDFLPRQFMAMASSRLKCIYYAESMEDIGSFIDGDLSGFIGNHKSVVNCELAGFIFDDFVVTKDYMHMCVKMDVLLDCNIQGHIEQQEETVMVRFTKVRDSIMSEDFYHDWYVTDVWNE